MSSLLIYPEIGLCSNEVPSEHRERLEAEAAMYWDRFYNSNQDRCALCASSVCMSIGGGLRH
jgi:hypothetical protein